MRPARALIDLDALQHNYRLARRTSAGRALAVIKADAYGHGAVRCAQHLAAEADGFAVACIEEALELREAGISQPILLLEGFFEPGELELVVQQQLWCVVHSHWQIETIERANLSAPITVWLKLDSGMHRVGFAPADYFGARQRLMASGKVKKIVLMSHFARADEPDCPRTAEQLAVFHQARADLQAEVSLCNSPALLGWPQVLAHQTPNDWVRPGIMLYGTSPFEQAQALADQLRPVMSLTSRIIGVRELPAGEPVGYGSRFICDRPTRVGVVAMGYADGYPRHAPNGTPVQVDGLRTRLIGRVSMDMLTLDLTDLPGAGLGSEVELWGKHVCVGEVARHADTIAYQLFCNLKRVRRDYVGC
ncbi:Alanine racemase [Stutzerimonas frequens]|jgi:alanine racemase|uniref:alanine racemase n=1 Tax=Stutzerimonas frequens TaxID=2968969 RepID=UPI001268BAC3|nr:alanine racemase [Stutzerimonas frequens]MBG5824987.1 alanine racemase [Pseudomonas aeruginosa]MCT5955012.1 alanine racemase [Pseudomonas aeruginosa]QFU12475.1 Alanine racemase [Stutzerimonas frequens]HBO5115563.1 alanine racemase [Pseudomonas aeruginosa]HCF3018083.1 alanine racemase [Pseudomonas aeruginosa]|tara:strand:+ start:7515 stop:8603 length:1089 start_codon:yes stop_codon:yes gene_type:complete